MSFAAGDLVAGLLFGGIGFVAFAYGKKMMNLRAMALGGALMAYPYFTPPGAPQWVVGAALTAALYLSREA